MTRARLEENIEQQISRIGRLIQRRKKVSSRYSKVRIGYFLIALLSVILSYDYLETWLYLTSITGWVTGFLVLVDRHRRVYESQEKFEHLRNIKQEHLARMNLDWSGIEYRSLVAPNSHHPFASDLDLTGKHSLMHLIDTSVYEGSTSRLYDWMLETRPDKALIENRQKLVRELVPLSSFRDKLRVIGKFTIQHTSERDWSNKDMLQWLRLPKKEGIRKVLIVQVVLVVFNFIFAALLISGLTGGLPLMVSFLSYVLMYKLNSHKVSGLFDAAFQIQKILVRLSAILLHIEKFKFREGSGIAQLVTPFQQAEERPSRYLRKIGKLMGAASLQKNTILWGIVNLMIPWDMFYAWKLEEMKPDLDRKFTDWLDLLYQLEALSSIATFSMLNPEYCWPEFSSNDEVLFNAESLGHPLIRRRNKVVNDFTIHEGKDLFLITGSNMAGKSTFLRTVGINLVLAYAGAPADALSMRTNIFRLFTSINVNDSLDDGLSHFYAEVKRLRYLLDELNQTEEFPLFFFVDEIYKGTNNRERYAGSAAFLKEVAGKNGVGMVSSHDLELADLEKQIAELQNLHFVESISHGKMTFEYKLRSGPCPSTNALKIMQMEGLPVQSR